MFKKITSPVKKIKEGKKENIHQSQYKFSNK